MASKELTTVMEELTRQGALNRREHLLNRREHRLNRRAYEEGLALCARLVERTEGTFQASIHALRAMTQEIEENTRELRAQREAIFKVIDRMDRLDGGSQTA